jgi:uncharacterized HhH-GPD family protein
MRFGPRYDPVVASAIHFTGDPAADRFLAESPLALMIGFVLDQQVTVQKAFASPLVLRERLGGLDARAIAETDPDALVDVFKEKPALHRFPGSMAKRTQELCAVIADEYGNDASRIWTQATDAADLEQRLLALPGIGPMKARTLFAVLVKRLGIKPKGWQAKLPDHRTLGDVDSPAALLEYQAAKRAHKAALRAAAS